MVEVLQAFVNQGSEFEGKVAFSGAVRIDGRFRGEASAEGVLVIGESGTVEADMHLGSLVVHGHFKGSVHATERVEVSETGVVDGEIHAPCLVVAEGARISGHVSTGERS
jgi:cytoskeletal protein CcmA (bactofilin family)